MYWIAYDNWRRFSTGVPNLNLRHYFLLFSFYHSKGFLKQTDLINGFFVASEFALLGVRRSRIETLAEKGSLSAKRPGFSPSPQHTRYQRLVLLCVSHY